jgi:hypothetical protein
MIGEADDITGLELSRGGDPRSVEVAAIEAAKIKEVKTAVLLSDHGVTTGDPRVGYNHLTLRASPHNGDVGQFDFFSGIGALENTFHDSR